MKVDVGEARITLSEGEVSIIYTLLDFSSRVFGTENESAKKAEQMRLQLKSAWETHLLRPAPGVTNGKPICYDPAQGLRVSKGR